MGKKSFIRENSFNVYNGITPYFRLFTIIISVLLAYDRVIADFTEKQYFIVFLGAYFIYSIAIIIFQKWRRKLTSKFPYILPIIDMLFVSLVVAVSGGSDSQYYLLYILFIVFFSIAHGLLQAIIGGLLSVIFYGITIILLEGSISRNMIFRLVFLIILTCFTSILNGKVYDHTYSIAMRDSLTSLYNYKFFYNCLDNFIQRSVKTGVKSSIALLDIDNFKNFNDKNGHQAGDLLLMAISSAIKINIRYGDIAARYGGDELAIIFPDTKCEIAVKVCERIKDLIQEKFIDDEGEQVTISIGIATTPVQMDGANSIELMHAADSALYKAKNSGKNIVICA